MTTSFDVITEDFHDDLAAIESLVLTFSDEQNVPPKSRIAAANSATLLVAATFEEFIREMAREYARLAVQRAGSLDNLPRKLASVAWRRTMEALARVPIDEAGDVFTAAEARFTGVYEFCRGDLTQDIYADLIHNENNMRPTEINGLFKLSALDNVCSRVASTRPILDYFGETEAGKAHGKLLPGINDFMERRNEIAHALGRRRSDGPDQILKDIKLLASFGQGLRESLNNSA